MNKLRYQSNLMLAIICIALILGNILITNLGVSDSFMEVSYQYLFILVPVIIYILITRQKFKKVLSLNKVNPLQLLIAMLLALVSQPFISLVANAMNMVFPGSGYGMQMPTSGGYSLIFAIFLMAITPAICEEVLMRGVVLHGHKGGTVWKVALLNGVLFGIFHNNFEQMFYAAAFGAILAFVVLYTDSIYPAILMHFMMNGLSTLGEYYPNSTYMKLTNIYESNMGVLIPLGIMSLIGVIILIKYLKKISIKKNRAIESPDDNSVVVTPVTKVLYPEWPLIIVTAISVIYSVIYY